MGRKKDAKGRNPETVAFPEGINIFFSNEVVRTPAF